MKNVKISIFFFLYFIPHAGRERGALGFFM
jgi:hypothetical protein